MRNKSKKNSFYTVSREDYLIAVYLLHKNQGQVRSVDIADMLGYSKPSVSNGVHLLIKKGLLEMKDGYLLSLTDEGREKAEEIYERYIVVKNYLQYLLRVNQKTAETDSRRIEHLISPETLKKMSDCLLQAGIKGE